MIVAKLLDGGVVRICDVDELPTPVPENWVVPCPNSFLTTWVDLLTHENGEILLKDAQEIEHAVLSRTGDTWQECKSYTLKLLENMYVQFLTVVWTGTLRTAGVIPADYTITVENTDEQTNTFYLIGLRQIDFDAYDKMADEFVRLKTYIEANGGVMSEVVYHDLSV